MSVALDASAVLAVMKDEPGAERVANRLSGAHLCVVNFSEIVAKLAELKVETDGLTGDLTALGVTLTPLDPDRAMVMGRLRPKTRGHGLSLGDRACLALALSSGVPALTADRAWAELDIGVEIEVIR